MSELLIIDDDPAKLRVLTLLLTGAGHSVMFATDAEGGLLMARFRRPALILLDISMRGLDGPAATTILGSDPLTADIPILASTAMAVGITPGNEPACWR
jgi:two-component system cell cycle response regulator DivK